MIKGFRHSGLRRFFEKDDGRKINANHRGKVRRILTRLHAAAEIPDCDGPGLRLHPLKGDRKGEWGLEITGNWRITFKWDGGDVIDVDYEDYH